MRCETELINQAWTIIILLLLLTIGNAAVSIHYRKRYEKIRDMLKRHFNVEADELKV